MSQKKVSPSQSGHDEEYAFGPLLGQNNKPYRVFRSEMTIQEVSYYIPEVIGSPLEYTEMIHEIRTAGAHDQIYIFLNTVGGNVDTGIQLINAIRDSDATVTTVLEGQAFSMGALLFLCGDKQSVSPHSRLMFHMYSGGGHRGKGNESLQKCFRRPSGSAS
jgi:ATP-dependent protease ClpP protease subunit